MGVSVLFTLFVPVVQRIEHQPSKLRIQVRFLAGTHKKSHVSGSYDHMNSLSKGIAGAVAAGFVIIIGTVWWTYQQTMLRTDQVQSIGSEEAMTCESIGEYSECLLVTPEVQIIAAYVPNGTFEATLIAKTADGRQVEQSIPYGVDRIFESEGGYFVVATNRENERIIGFDEVLLVTLAADGPRIRTVIADSGFGEYDDSVWYHIPFRDRGNDTFTARDLTLRYLDALGVERESWNFGVTLVTKANWQKEFWLHDTQLLEDGNILLLFGGSCAEEKYPVCARYILDTVTKEIKSVER